MEASPRLVPLLAALPLAVAGLALLGWSLDFPTLSSMLPGLPTMKAHTAIGIAAVAAGLLAASFRMRIISWVCSAVSAGLAGLTLAQWWTGIDLGIDQLLVDDRLTPPDGFPGRPSEATALALLLLSGSLVLATAHDAKRRRMSEALALATATMSYFAGTCYLFDFIMIGAIGAFAIISIPTAAASFILSIGLLVLHGADGVFGTLVRGSIASNARRLMPLALLLPIVIGWLVGSHGLNFGTNEPFKLAVVALCNSLTLCLFFVIVTRDLNRVEQGRRWTADKAQWLDLDARLAEWRQAQATADTLQQRNLELEAARKVADRASTAKSSFLASMSHELRTPLNSILGFSRLLATAPAGEVSDRCRRYADLITASGEHLLVLINDILDLTQIDAHEVRLSLEPVAVGPLLDELRQMLEGKARARKVVLPPWPATDLVVHADRSRLFQIMLNLVDNAIKYNREGGTVAIEVAAVGGSAVRIAVIDTGTGIRAERQKEVFQRFNRLGAETGRIEGTGIGLSIVQELVTLMHGRIGMHSDEGQGSTFWITLPRTSETPTRGRSSAPNWAPTQTALAVPAQRVLCIEDNPPNRELVAAFLGRLQGIEVELATTAEEGVQLARSRPPGLVLLDMHLPDSDGREVLRRLRADPATSKLRIVALSADAMPDAIAAAMALGFDAYLTKPIYLEQLVAVLRGPTAAAGAEADAAIRKPGAVIDELILIELEQTIGPTQLARMVASLPAQLEALLVRLSAAVTVGNHARTVELAHEINGVAANFALSQARRLAAEVERLAEGGQDVGASQEALASALRAGAAELSRRMGPTRS